MKIPIRTHSSISNNIQACVLDSGVFLASLAYYSPKGGDFDLLVLTLEKVLSTLHRCVQRLVFKENLLSRNHAVENRPAFA